jgi:hypothetical protein
MERKIEWTGNIRNLILSGDYRGAADAARAEHSGIDWNDDVPDNPTLQRDCELFSVVNECHCARLCPDKQDKDYWVACALLRLDALEGDKDAAGKLSDKIEASALVAQYELDNMQ